MYKIALPVIATIGTTETIGTIGTRGTRTRGKISVIFGIRVLVLVLIF